MVPLSASGPDAIEIVGLVASAVATVLAVFTIWQSWALYRWSERSRSDAQKSSDAIAASVAKLEEFFDRFYGDTFGMMRDTVEDIRKHAWPRQADEIGDETWRAVAAREAERVDSLRRDLKEAVESAGSDREKIAQLEARLERILERAVEDTREAADESAIARALYQSGPGRATAVSLLRAGRDGLSGRQLAEELGISPASVSRWLRRLEELGAVESTQAGRERLWRLTGAGHAVAQQAAEAQKRHFDPAILEGQG